MTWQQIDGKWVWTYTVKGKVKYCKKPPLKAIKLFCKDKCNVDECQDQTCPLFAFRRGFNPNRKIRQDYPQRAENGHYKPVYTGGLLKIQGKGKDCIVPDSYEVIIRRKKEKT